AQDALYAPDAYRSSDHDPVIVGLYLTPTEISITGGGWIDSLSGAYVRDAALTGKANFGFVAQYLTSSTVPEGTVEFQFSPGDLNFHSTYFEWLVVTGGNTALIKGAGTVNGMGNYYFLLKAVDS